MSIISQTFQDFEICLVDGASSDTTVDKAIKLRADCKNIRIISESDKGVYDAMNKGIEMAQGDWLYFIGSDDEIFDRKVFADVFQSPIPQQYGMIYGNVYLHDDTAWAKAGHMYDGLFDINKLLDRNICHQAVFYRKELFHKFGNYKTQYKICADWDINLRFFPKTQVLYLDRAIAGFYGGGLSSQESQDPFDSDLENLRKRAMRTYKVRQLKNFLNLT